MVPAPWAGAGFSSVRRSPMSLVLVEPLGPRPGSTGAFLGGWCAYHQSADPPWAENVPEQDQEPRARRLPAEARRVHPRVHHHAEEAALGSPQGGPDRKSVV